MGRFGDPAVQAVMQRLTNWERCQVARAFGRQADPKQRDVTPKRLTTALIEIHSRRPPPGLPKGVNLVQQHGTYTGRRTELRGQSALLMVKVGGGPRSRAYAQFDNLELTELAYGWHPFQLINFALDPEDDSEKGD